MDTTTGIFTVEPMHDVEAMYLGSGDVIRPTPDETALVIDAVTRWTPYGATTELTYRYGNTDTNTTIRVGATSMFPTKRHPFNLPVEFKTQH